MIENQFYPTMFLSKMIYQSAHPAGENEWTVEWFEAQVKNKGFTEFKWIENKKTDTQTCLCVKDDFVYLTVRGSSTGDDWVTNLDFKLIPFVYGEVHRGFWQDAGSVYYSIVSELVDDVIKKRKLIISGHSQGAGVAYCLAAMLLEHNRDIEFVIGYGGPRVFDSNAVDYLNSRYSNIFYRVVNNNDIVTRVPPRIFGYKHIGMLHYFKGDRVYTTDISDWERFKDRMKYKVDFGGEYGFDILDDHSPNNYFELIRSNFS